MAVYLGVGNNGSFVTSDDYTLVDANGLTLTAYPSVSKYKVILNNIVYRINVNLNKKEGE